MRGFQMYDIQGEFKTDALTLSALTENPGTMCHLATTGMFLN